MLNENNLKIEKKVNRPEIQTKNIYFKQDAQKLTNIQKLTISSMVIALYCIVMYFTQSISFGPYQIRVATSFYALAYLYPFLILPLGISNFLSNLLGGLGMVDMLGGFYVGIITAFIITLIRRYKLPTFTCMIPIILIPGTMVPIWLSIIHSLPYGMLVISLCIGQIIPSILGVLLIKILSGVLNHVTE